jgi:hypothetical protein
VWGKLNGINLPQIAGKQIESFDELTEGLKGDINTD